MAEQLVVSPLVSRDDTASEFSAWVADHQRPLLAFAQLIAGDAQTGEDLLQTALARAYLKWPKIGSTGQHPLGYVRRIIVNENVSLWRRAWKRRERSTSSPPEREMVEATPIDTIWAWSRRFRLGNGPRSPCGSIRISRWRRPPMRWVARRAR
jgi:DNA-directed RNA polymerase specialized sigma24 family protein